MRVPLKRSTLSDITDNLRIHMFVSNNNFYSKIRDPIIRVIA